MHLTDLNTVIQKTSSLTRQYASLTLIFNQFHSHILTLLESNKYQEWEIEVSDLTDTNDFFIELAGRKILFIFDIEPDDSESYLGAISAYMVDDYLYEISEEIASFTFNSNGLAEDISGLDGDADLKLDTHCLNIALAICLSVFDLNLDFELDIDQE